MYLSSVFFLLATCLPWTSNLAYKIHQRTLFSFTRIKPHTLTSSLNEIKKGKWNSSFYTNFHTSHWIHFTFGPTWGRIRLDDLNMNWNQMKNKRNFEATPWSVILMSKYWNWMKTFQLATKGLEHVTKKLKYLE